MAFLPPEMWRTIFLYVKSNSFRDLKNCSLVCKEWKNIIRDDPIILKELGMKSKLKRSEKIQFLETFERLRVLRINSDDLSFVKSRDHDVCAAMENIEKIIINADKDNTGYKMDKTLVLKEENVPNWCWWEPIQIICDVKSLKENLEFVHYGFDQVLGIHIYFYEFHYEDELEDELLVDECEESAEALVNLKHITIESSDRPLTRNELRLLNCIRPQNLESISIETFGRGLEPAYFSGDPFPSVRKLHLDTSVLQDLQQWIEVLARKYPKVSHLSVELEEGYIDEQRILTILESLSSSSLDLSRIEVDLNPQEEDNLVTVCKITRERVQEYFSERVSFVLSYPFYIKQVHSRFDPEQKLKVVKEPFKDPEYLFWVEEPAFCHR